MKIWLAGFMMLLLPFSGFSQKIQVETEADQSIPKGGRSGGRNFIRYDKNLLSFNYTLLLRGVIQGSYQRMINDKLGVEGSLGLTYRDFVFEAIHLTDDLFNSLEKEDKFSNLDFGPSVQLAAMYYPGQYDNFGHPYIKGLVSYRAYNMTPGKYTTTVRDQYGYTVQSKEVSYDRDYSFIDLGLVIGSQREYTSKIVVSNYIGFGLRHASYTKPHNVFERTTSEGPSTERVSKVMPMFYLGYNFGLPF